MPSLLQSISSFFSSPSPTAKRHSHIRRDQAMSSIDDAFSVPPDDYVSSPSLYTYPPPAQGSSYDTVPQASYDHRAANSSPSRSRPASLLPLHHTPALSVRNYPPLEQTWARLRAWLDEQYPELADTLNWGLPAPELSQFELQLGFALPPAVRDSYLLVDGQEAESATACPEGLFFGLTLLPFEDVLDEWRFWRAVDDDPLTGANTDLREAMRSIPPGWIRREYSQRGWLPLAADKAGNYLGVDMNPDERGVSGQVIVFGRDFDTKVVMWRGDGEGGWARWLASFVDELESGEGFEVGMASDGGEGSEDDVGYESYFFDGTGGKGEGGGDGGRGGLRLTGEYKGWPVLEALADRSMKRWIEAGVMSPPTPVRVASTNAIELGLEPSSSKSPILAKDDNSPMSTPVNGYSFAEVAPLPTKAPAPLPVPIPTERDLDLLHSPTFSPLEHYDEEEAIESNPSVRANPVQSDFPEEPLVSIPSSDSAPTLHPVRQPTDPNVNESHMLLEPTSPTVDAELFSVGLDLTPADPPRKEADIPAAMEDTPHPSTSLSRVNNSRGEDSKISSAENVEQEEAEVSARRKLETA